MYEIEPCDTTIYMDVIFSTLTNQYSITKRH